MENKDFTIMLLIFVIIILLFEVHVDEINSIIREKEVNIKNYDYRDGFVSSLSLFHTCLYELGNVTQNLTPKEIDEMVDWDGLIDDIIINTDINQTDFEKAQFYKFTKLKKYYWRTQEIEF